MARPANAHDNTLVRDFLITQIQTEGTESPRV